MVITLVAPGEVDDPWNKVKKASYKGWGIKGDVLYFPHVESCCALILLGERYIIGAHMGEQLPKMSDPNPVVAGRWVWQQVVADYRRLNLHRPKIITVGAWGWYSLKVVDSIWKALNPIAALQLEIGDGPATPTGVDVWARTDRLTVRKHNTKLQRDYNIPAEGNFPLLEKIRF